VFNGHIFASLSVTEVFQICKNLKKCFRPEKPLRVPKDHLGTRLVPFRKDTISHEWASLEIANKMYMYDVCKSILQHILSIRPCAFSLCPSKPTWGTSSFRNCAHPRSNRWPGYHIGRAVNYQVMRCLLLYIININVHVHVHVVILFWGSKFISYNGRWRDGVSVIAEVVVGTPAWRERIKGGGVACLESTNWVRERVPT
jgi:hypothetical protein